MQHCYNGQSMGQLALGFRSLLTRAAIFFVMAALLAWALGGTLWPRPAYAAVWPEKPVNVGGTSYYWRLTIESGRPGRVTMQRPTWQLMALLPDETSEPADERTWSGGTGPVHHPSNGIIYFGARDENGQWWIDDLAGSGAVSMPDRLSVEIQLARLAEGQPLQDREEILAKSNITGKSTDK